MASALAPGPDLWCWPALAEVLVKLDAESWKEKGNQAIQEKKYDDAIKHYSQAIAMDPSLVQAYSNRAAAWSLKGVHANALADAEMAIAEDPSFVKAYSRKGKALFDSGRFDEAETAYKNGLQVDEVNAGCREGLTHVLAWRKEARSRHRWAPYGGARSPGPAAAAPPPMAAAAEAPPAALAEQRAREAQLVARLADAKDRAEELTKEVADLRSDCGFYAKLAEERGETVEYLQGLATAAENCRVAEAEVLRTKPCVLFLQALNEELGATHLSDLHELQREVIRSQHHIAKELERRSMQSSRSTGSWQWRTDDGTFVDFEPNAMMRIATHVADSPKDAQGRCSLELKVRNMERDVCINFIAMEQTVDGGSGRRRPIRLADEIMLREPSWTQQQPGQAELVLVEPSSAEYSKVLTLMFTTEKGALGSDFMPVSVHRVQNMFLLRNFEAERHNLIDSRGASGVGERSLFHGTGCHVPHEVALNREGFMVDYASAGFYGRGLYYAERPLYSHLYAHRSTVDGVTHYAMLVCRVLCGRWRNMGTTTDRAMNRLKLPSALYDSVLGGPHQPDGDGAGDRKSMMYVVYKEAQVYPDFIITYREKLPGETPPLVPREAA